MSKQIRINGIPAEAATLEEIKAKFPNAKIYETPFIISVIVK